MTQYQVGTFLELDGIMRMNEIRISGNCYKYTIEHQIIFPICQPIPVIQKNCGCTGLAVIRKFTITENYTEIEFEFSTISDSARTAFYQIYKNTMSMSHNSHDPYANSDMIIPGAMSRQVPLNTDDDDDYDDDDDDFSMLRPPSKPFYL